MFTIDYKSRIPIYRQIIDNVEKLAAKGILAPDSQLPSVRSLAVELSINPNTIAKAYAELEKQGVIYSMAGKGSFITTDTQKLWDQGKVKVKKQLQDVAGDAVSLQIEEQEFASLCNDAWQKATKGGNEAND